MQVIDNENIVAIDVDDTILIWDNPTVPGVGKIPLEFAGETVYLTPHTYHIQLIKMYKERGYFVIVWSANGRHHVKRAITALGIEKYVDLGMTKLSKHLDDSDNAASILGPRVYTKDFTKPVEEAKYFVPYGYDIINCSPLSITDINGQANTIGGIANGR